jgi:hypothetical protein
MMHLAYLFWSVEILKYENLRGEPFLLEKLNMLTEIIDHV